MVAFWPKNKMEASTLETIYNKLYETKSKNNTLEEFYVDDGEKKEVKSLHDRRKKTPTTPAIPPTTTTTTSTTPTAPALTTVPPPVVRALPAKEIPSNISPHFHPSATLVGSNVNLAHYQRYMEQLVNSQPSPSMVQPNVMASVVSNTPGGTKIQFAYPNSLPPNFPFASGNQYPWQNNMSWNPNPQQK
jgi:hypothetical protein